MIYKKAQRLRHHILVVAAGSLIAMALSACGGSSADSANQEVPATTVSPTCVLASTTAACASVTGGTFSTGAFVATIANNAIPPSANAVPLATAVSAVPADVMVNSYETNVTAGAKAYTLTIGNTGFTTGTVGNVRLEVPFDRTLVADKTKIDSLHLLLRIFNAEDKSVVNLTGQIVGDRVVVEMTGFPASATITVLFNPNMDVVANDAPSLVNLRLSAVAEASGTSPARQQLAQLSGNSWTTRNWAVVYDAVEVADSVKTFLGIGTEPTADQIRQIVKLEVANHAADAAAIYQGEGFRAPTLYVAQTAAEAGGSSYGTTPRYLLHYQALQSAKFFPADPNELIGPDANHYGRVYIQTSNLNYKYANSGMSIYGIIAHELFHAVQAGYGLAGKTYLKGVREGSATAYGDLLDRRHNGNPAAIPQVRQGTRFPTQIANETFKLDVYLLIEQAVDSLPYANQDFFVYLARTIGNNNFKYLATAFEQLRLTLEDEANKQATPAAIVNALNSPERASVLKGFDNFLSANYGTTLVRTYDDFVQQRVMLHNTASQFGRPGETTNGLAVNLLNNFLPSVTLKEVQVDPGSDSTTVVNDLVPMWSLSSRVLRIRPAVGKLAGNVTISVALSKGAFGTMASGWIYRTASAASARTATPLQAANTVEGFGTDSADELTIVLSNPSFDSVAVGAVFDIKGTKAASSALSGVIPNLNSFLYLNDYVGVTHVVTDSGTGTWSMTGDGIELIGVQQWASADGLRQYYQVNIYSPGSTGTITITSNQAWDASNFKEWINPGAFPNRSVVTYLPLEFLPLAGDAVHYSSDVTLSATTTGLTAKVNYVFPKIDPNTAQIANINLSPQIGLHYDINTYNLDGTLLNSDKGNGGNDEYIRFNVTNKK
jgi:hypothetical protein